MAERSLFLRAYEGRAPFAKRRLLLLVAAAFLGLPILPSTIGTVDASRYAFTSHTFTPCGATGSNGPVLSQCTSAYNTSWAGLTSNFNITTQGIQQWTVPVTGLYEITAAGARGGGSNPGSGRIVKGRVLLNVNEVLRIIVGQEGVVSGGSSLTGGGGGGSFVATSSNVALVVGGGGGGSADSGAGSAGSTTTCGITGTNTGAPGGCDGAGGGARRFSGGGAGFTSNGTTKLHSSEAAVPASFVNGGVGGVGGLPGGGHGGHGGFGGGGGSCACSTGGGGGGGGYGGGGGGGPQDWGAYGGGGGGGSYVIGSATAVNTNVGTRAGAGYVTIEIVAPVVSQMTPSVSSPSNVSALDYSISFSESVTGFGTDDITLTGTSAGWSIVSLSGSGAGPYVLSLASSAVSTGTLIVTVATNAVTGVVSAMQGPPAPNSTTMNIDIDPPTASVASAPTSPAAAVSLTFGLSFSESVSGIGAADFSNAGTAVGCVFTPGAASGSSVNVVVTQCQEGTLRLRLAQNSVMDAAGNAGPVTALDSATITLAASALSVTAGDKSVNFGGSWTDSHSQSGLLGSDTIAVTYSYSGATTLGTPYGPSATKPTAGGTYSIIPAVSYGAGNANRYTLTRNNGTLTIARVNQAVLTVSSTTATFGQSLPLVASGGSGAGAVTWSKVSGTCTISGSTLTPGDAGSTCMVQATKAADDNYVQVASSATAVTINKANQAALTVTSTSATYGEALNLVASGGSGTGAVTWSKVSGTCSVTSGGVLTPGDAGSSCVVKASKSTDTNYNQADSANRAITIDKAPQSGFSITSATSFTTGSTHTLTASGGQTSGSVSWSVTSGNCVLSGTSLTSSRGGVTCGVSAMRAGDSNHLPSTDTMTVTVNKIAQVLTFRSTVPAIANPGGTYTVSVDSDASLAPTIAIANSSSSVCSISAGVVTFNSVGTCLISASQSGNDAYSSAAASQTVTVTAVAAAAPASTVPLVTPTFVAPAATVAPADTVAPTTTTIPSKGTATTVPRPAATTTTTTTTTTTAPPRQDPGAPNAGVDGQAPDLAQGETTAMVRGKQVKVAVEQADGQVVMRLPNKVTLRIGTTDPTARSAQINADGVLVAYRGETIAVTAEGFVAGTTYTVYMFSDPLELGRGEASPAGEVSTVVEVPSDVKTGGHTLQINGVGAGDEVVSVSLGFKVAERQDNTRAVVISLTIAVLLALLGGRPVFRRRRRPV